MPVRRLQLRSNFEDGHVLPSAFDRWKRFVKVRQLIGWHLNNTYNRLTPLKCDLSLAFNRWKSGAGVRRRQLEGTLRTEQLARETAVLNNLFDQGNRADYTEQMLMNLTF